VATVYTTSIFDLVREQVPLESVVSLDGHGRKALCVAHDEQKPSMHIYENHVYCYGCGWHGDVTDVYAKTHNITRPIEAARALAEEFGIPLPEISEKARRKAEKAREMERDLLEEARELHEGLAGYPAVVEWWERRGFGEELRERYLLGAASKGTATIPFWHRGRVKGIIRRRLKREPKYILPAAEEFPEGHKPLFIPGGAPREGGFPLRGGEIFIVEGYLDALALEASAGWAVAIGGTGASEIQISELRKFARVYILPDADSSGEEAASKWARALYPAARICPADYGSSSEDDDIAAYFARYGPEKTFEHVGRLVEASSDILDLEMEKAKGLDDRRERLAYVRENIAPLLVPLEPEGLRDATADIVCETVRLKKKWVDAAIKDERGRRLRERAGALEREMEAEMKRREEEYLRRVEEVKPEIDELLAPGILRRLRNTAAAVHNVFGDREPLELAILVALGAQLAPLPNGRPLGASILLTAPPSRGKNHIFDAATKLLPESFYFAFEKASGQSFYYKADEDPAFFRHKFVYPNEVEGVEDLWEFMRPMLSKANAYKIVTAKDALGNMVSREIEVKGPVTIAVPTIRNKVDDQMQSRLLVAELPDYAGRIKEHSLVISQQVRGASPGAGELERLRFLWGVGLLGLTEHRRVIFPLDNDRFALDNDDLSSGARLWANLISLMLVHAWLEQRNRSLVELPSGETAIVATPRDYAAAYRIFRKVCSRGTVLKLKESHTKILNGLYRLQEDQPERYGFRQREISEAAGVSQSTVAENRTYLVTSVKLMRESDDGLALVEGADPSWWTSSDLMKGFPTPAQVRAWWKTADQADQPIKAPEEGQKPHTYAGNSDRYSADQEPITDRPDGGADHDRLVIGKVPISKNGIGKPKTEGEEAGDRLIGPIGDSEEDPGVKI
jgi:DNA primase